MAPIIYRRVPVEHAPEQFLWQNEFFDFRCFRLVCSTEPIPHFIDGWAGSLVLSVMDRISILLKRLEHSDQIEVARLGD